MALDRTALEDTFLTVAEVAELLKLNPQTVRNWIDQGSLPALRVGRRVRIRRSDLERLLEASYSGNDQEQARGPSAEDFWGGEAVGLAEPAAEGASPGLGGKHLGSHPTVAPDPTEASEGDR